MGTEEVSVWLEAHNGERQDQLTQTSREGRVHSVDLLWVSQDVEKN